MIAAAMGKDGKEAIGKYLDAASEAAGQLRANPSNAQARQDYNFAVGRIYEELHEIGGSQAGRFCAPYKTRASFVLCRRTVIRSPASM
jgi:hypothetical protein